ncbi:MAG TPA: SDR family NAD(P)-dependent oxidoreductase [Tepidisphaeraceae bacterium]|nr:SDR family NAD(P)-dependent oxidoreductase [Tepidisphaeraceae bacterium]
MAEQKILVTGAAGFIGSRLAKALLDRGDRVIGLDNLNDYYALEHKHRHLADLGNGRFTFIQADLQDADATRELLAREKPDAIAHLAAMAAVRYSVKHPLIYGHINVQGSINLLDAARQQGGTTPPKVVLASTGSVYGSVTPVPFNETAAAAEPLAPYPASKRAMELFAHTYHHLFGLPITVLRFFNVYGPHGRPDMMPWQWSRMILAGEPLILYGAGKLQRDWTYIDDIVAGFLAALGAGLQWEIINLGCGRPVENLDFVQTLETLWQKKAIITDVPTPASEPFITFADVSKAERLLGYKPRINVAEGLEQFVRWIRDEKIPLA